MKILKWVLIVLVVLVVIVVLAATVFLDSIVKTAVQTAGPAVIGAPITLKDVSISLFTGKVAMEGLVIGNPPGFQTDHAVKLDHFLLRLKPTSVFSKKIVIRQILIDGPEITYEVTLKGSNIGKISDNASGGSAPAPRRKPRRSRRRKPARRLRLMT